MALSSASVVIPQVRREQPAQRHVGKAPVRRDAVIGDVNAAKEKQAPVKADAMETSAGAFKAPKVQIKKEVRIAGGLIQREKEALARLLASF